MLYLMNNISQEKQICVSLRCLQWSHLKQNIAHITGTFEQFVNQLVLVCLLFLKIKVQVARALATFLYVSLCYRAASLTC